MKKISVELSEKYNIYIGEKELSSLPKLIEDFHNVDNLIIAMESKLKKFYLGMLKTTLATLKLPIIDLVLDVETTGKDLAAVHSVLSFMSTNKLGKNTLVLVVGGENFANLIGYAIALLVDAPKYALLPTSIITMLDANIEGDFYIDLQGVKRKLKAHISPSFIYADTCFLANVTQDDERECIAQIAKIEILKNMGLLDAALQFDISSMYTDLICECLKIKCGYALAAKKNKKINMMSIGEPYSTLVRINLGDYASEHLCDFYGLYILSVNAAKAYIGAQLIVDKLQQVAIKYDIDLGIVDTLNCSTAALRDALNTTGMISFVLPYAMGNCAIEDTSLTSPLMYTAKLAKKSKFDIKITDSKHLQGDINIFNSVSIGHNLILISSFAATRSMVTKLVHNDDNQAVLNALRALGFSLIVGDDWCEITQADKFFAVLSSGGQTTISMDTKDSESALSTMMCLGAMLGLKITFKGNDKILTVQIKEQIMYMRSLGVVFDKPTLPFTMSGFMNCTEYKVNNMSNEQLMIGLLVGGFCARAQFDITINSSVKNSPAAIMIMELIKKMGGKVTAAGNTFNIDCSMIDISDDLNMNGDSSVSNLACWMTMKAMGANIKFSNSVKTISRVDKSLLDFINNINKPGEKSTMDISLCADLSPYIAVMNLALKRYYTLQASTDDQAKVAMLNELQSCIAEVGGKSDFTRRQLSIYVAELHSATIYSYQDPRIIMAFAALSIAIKGDLVITDAHAVAKSYPTFWDDFARLGAEFEVVNVDSK